MRNTRNYVSLDRFLYLSSTFFFSLLAKVIVKIQFDQTVGFSSSRFSVLEYLSKVFLKRVKRKIFSCHIQNMNIKINTEYLFVASWWKYARKFSMRMFEVNIQFCHYPFDMYDDAFCSVAWGLFIKYVMWKFDFVTPNSQGGCLLKTSVIFQLSQPSLSRSQGSVMAFWRHLTFWLGP